MKKINNEVNKKAFALPSHKKRNDSVMSLVLSFTDFYGVEFSKFSFDYFKNIIED